MAKWVEIKVPNPDDYFVYERMVIVNEKNENEGMEIKRIKGNYLYLTPIPAGGAG